MSPEIDRLLREASEDVATHLGFEANWLNSAPKDLVKDMSAGWQERIVQIFQASHLTIYSISREEIIFSKFYAYCDRQKDVFDLLALRPTESELARAAELTRIIDGHPDWP